MNPVKSFIDFIRYKDTIKKMTVDIPELVNIESGIYEGSADAILVKASVRVVIKEHEIKELSLLHHVHDHGEAAEEVIERIREKGSFDVDVISGASNSSKVILKAIENSFKENSENK